MTQSEQPAGEVSDPVAFNRPVTPGVEQDWYDDGVDAGRAAATNAAVARMRELAEKWREDRRTYPYNEHGIVASVAIRACAIELATLADELDHP